MKLSNFRPIGRGRYSTVYVAEQAPQDRLVAVRVVEGIDDPEDWYRFEDECLTAAALSDRVGIVAVHDVSLTPDGVGQVVMAYLEGGSLAGLLATRGTLSDGQAVAIGESVAITLALTHTEGIRHGDVKPSNLLVGKTGDVRLGDFGTPGLSAALGHAGDLSTSAHLAPEILRGEAGSSSGDVYSLASTMYELVQGYSPFQRRGNLSAATMRARKLTELPRKPAAVQSPALTAAVMAALAPNPADRPTAAEFLDLLGECDMEPLFDRHRPVAALALGPIVANPLGGTDEPSTPAVTEAPPEPVVEGPWAAHLAPGTTVPGPPADVSRPVPPARPPHASRDRRKLVAVMFASVAAALAVGFGIVALSDGGGADGTAAAGPATTTAPLELATAATVPASSPATAATIATTGTATTATSVGPSTSVSSGATSSSSAAPTTRPVVVTTAPRTTTTVAGTPTTSAPAVSTTASSTRPVAPVPPTAAATTTTAAPTVTVGPVTPPVPVTPTPTTAAPPITPAPTLAPVTTAPVVTQPPVVAPAVGSLSLNSGSTRVSAVANSADRCANSHWVLSGPVSYDQSSNAPSGCFSSAHAFDSSWYQLTLTPGSYRLSLTVTKNGQSSTTSSSFTISG